MTYASDFSADGVRALVSATDHHLVNDNLLGAENDAIAADYSHHSAIIRIQESINQESSNGKYGAAYLEVSTAFSAYSTWKIRPSGLSELHS